MNIIEVKKIPEGYFVSDKCYLSGGMQFVEKINITSPTYSGKCFGTEGVKLVTVNPILSGKGYHHIEFVTGEGSPHFVRKSFTQLENIDEAYEINKRNKDLFVYRIEGVVENEKD